MDVEFADPDLDRLETDPRHSGQHAQEVVRGFRKVVNAIRAATDERDLHAMRSLRLEKLRSDREGQHSLRINRQWRLIVQFVKEGSGKKVRVIEIVDYH